MAMLKVKAKSQVHAKQQLFQVKVLEQGFEDHFYLPLQRQIIGFLTLLQYIYKNNTGTYCNYLVRYLYLRI